MRDFLEQFKNDYSRCFAAATATGLRQQFGQCGFTQPLHCRRTPATLGAHKSAATLLLNRSNRVFCETQFQNPHSQQSANRYSIPLWEPLFDFSENIPGSQRCHRTEGVASTVQAIRFEADKFDFWTPMQTAKRMPPNG